MITRVTVALVIFQTGPGSRFHVNDHVTIFSSETPFWSEYGIVEEEDLVKLDNRIPMVSGITVVLPYALFLQDLAATIMINPPTAWIMLQKYVKLEKGDYVIQNSSNSGVGRSVIELCRAFGYNSINIVRNRPNIENLKTDLWKIGADHVFTEEEFKETGRQVGVTVGLL